MARTHTTKTGEMLDLICFRYYGGRQAGAVEAVLEANHLIRLSLQGPVLPPGLVITLPDLPTAAARPATVKLWD